MASLERTRKLLSNGGDWMGTAHKWIQDNVRNGDKVTWGSDSSIQMKRGFLSVQDFEDLATKVMNATIDQLERMGE